MLKIENDDVVLVLRGDSTVSVVISTQFRDRLDAGGTPPDHYDVALLLTQLLEREDLMDELFARMQKDLLPAPVVYN